MALMNSQELSHSRCHHQRPATNTAHPLLHLQT
uniref:Uncharacterized protein n=1 Tax=Anguilla anguilla TaxID=7936 RepID=A0A0E9R6X6_ANGAN